MRCHGSPSLAPCVCRRFAGPQPRLPATTCPQPASVFLRWNRWTVHYVQVHPEDVPNDWARRPPRSPRVSARTPSRRCRRKRRRSAPGWCSPASRRSQLREEVGQQTWPVLRSACRETCRTRHERRPRGADPSHLRGPRTAAWSPRRLPSPSFGGVRSRLRRDRHMRQPDRASSRVGRSVRGQARRAKRRAAWTSGRCRQRAPPAS